MRIGYTVFWLDAHGFVFRSHYFETSSYIAAKKRVMRKIQHHRDKPEISGWFLTEAPASALRRFFDKSIYATPRDMTEIESHLYAPTHLIR